MVERVMGLLLAPVVHRSPEGSRSPVKLELAMRSDDRDPFLLPLNTNPASAECNLFAQSRLSGWFSSIEGGFFVYDG